MTRLSNRPWFRLKVLDGDEILGRKEPDGALILQVLQGWNDTHLRLEKSEVRTLLDWLKRVYGGDDGNEGGFKTESFTVISLSGRSRNPIKGPTGNRK